MLLELGFEDKWLSQDSVQLGPWPQSAGVRPTVAPLARMSLARWRHTEGNINKLKPVGMNIPVDPPQFSSRQTENSRAGGGDIHTNSIQINYKKKVE